MKAVRGVRIVKHSACDGQKPDFHSHRVQRGLCGCVINVYIGGIAYGTGYSGRVIRGKDSF